MVMISKNQSPMTTPLARDYTYVLNYYFYFDMILQLTLKLYLYASDRIIVLNDGIVCFVA